MGNFAEQNINAAQDKTQDDQNPKVLGSDDSPPNDNDFFDDMTTALAGLLAGGAAIVTGLYGGSPTTATGRPATPAPSASETVVLERNRRKEEEDGNVADKVNSGDDSTKKERVANESENVDQRQIKDDKPILLADNKDAQDKRPQFLKDEMGGYYDPRMDPDYTSNSNNGGTGQTSSESNQGEGPVKKGTGNESGKKESNKPVKQVAPEVKRQLVGNAIETYFEINGKTGQSSKILDDIGDKAESKKIKTELKQLQSDMKKLFQESEFGKKLSDKELNAKYESFLNGIKEKNGTDTLNLQMISTEIKAVKIASLDSAAGYYKDNIDNINKQRQKDPDFGILLDKLASTSYSQGKTKGDEALKLVFMEWMTDTGMIDNTKVSGLDPNALANAFFSGLAGGDASQDQFKIPEALQHKLSLTPESFAMLRDAYINFIRPVTMNAPSSTLAELARAHSTGNSKHTDSVLKMTKEQMLSDVQTAKDKGATKNDLPDNPTPTHKLVLDDKFGVYSASGTGDYARYVTPDFGEFLHDLAHSLPGDQKLWINDASLAGGTKYEKPPKGHSGHNTGQEIDIKMPTTNNEEPKGETLANPGNYSREKTIELIKTASKNLPKGKELEVIFNDAQVIEYFKSNPVDGVTVRSDKKKSQSAEHGTHLHFQFKKN